MKISNLLIALFAILFSIATSAQSDVDETKIEKLVQTMADGWTAGDGEKFASVFAAHHDYIVWNGYYFKNMSKERNAEAHQGLFNSKYKDTELHTTIDKVKFIKEDLALIHVLSAVVAKGEGRPVDPEVLWTSLLEMKNGEWKIISFHNLDLEVFQDEQTHANAPIPAEKMYSSWYQQQ